MSNLLTPVITNLGRDALMKGFSSPENYRFSQVALGDGGGNGYQPEPGSTSLKNELQRINVTSVVVQDSARLHITAVAGLPGENETANPFDIREIGFYLQPIAKNGEDTEPQILFAVYATEVDEKPLLTKEPATELLLAFDLLLPDIGDGDFKFDKDSYLHLPTADQDRSGMVRLATAEETKKGEIADSAVTPVGLKSTLQEQTVSPQGLKAAIDALEIPKAGSGVGDTIKDLSVTGAVSFGAQVRQMINLWNASYGIGIQNYTQYFRSDKNFAWYKKGIHDNTELAPGKDGNLQMALVDGKLGIGTAEPKADIDVESIRVRSQSFKVGGSFDKFYPIIFADNAWSDGILELEINRANVHTDVEWRGSLMSKFTTHSSNWGHGANFIRAEVHQFKSQFIADFKGIDKSTKLVVWLRGDTTYFWRANQPTILVDVKAVAKTIDEEKLDVKSAVKAEYAKEHFNSMEEPWQSPALENGWVRYSNEYNPPGFYKDSMGIVHLRGLMKSGTVTKSIFTLPAGYRPEFRELQATQTNANTIGRVDVLTNGQVVAVAGNAGWFSLDGVTFRAI